MSKPIPLIRKYMTLMPHSIGPDQTIALARKKMVDLGIRHLPVLSGGNIVGILSERDIDLLGSFKDVNMERALVNEAMIYDPYVTNPDKPLDEVCANMAERKIGSALIVDNGNLVGIFTYVDALQVLAEIFQTRLKK